MCQSACGSRSFPSPDPEAAFFFFFFFFFVFFFYFFFFFFFFFFCFFFFFFWRGGPLSALGTYLAAHLPDIDQLHPEPISYWLRKLIFRGAWLDHRVKTGMLDVSFDQESGSFGYRMPTDTSPLVELAPVPSWAALRYPG